MANVPANDHPGVSRSIITESLIPTILVHMLYIMHPSSVWRHIQVLTYTYADKPVDGGNLPAPGRTSWIIRPGTYEVNTVIMDTKHSRGWGIEVRIKLRPGLGECNVVRMYVSKGESKGIWRCEHTVACGARIRSKPVP